jgi:DtxR family transcriptional regulator, Mn-dependent transcriptional regulator
MAKETKLTRSLEDYLEAILLLETKNRVARVKDIANELGVQMPSVTGALKNLKNRGYINYEKNSFISLTEEGIQVAQNIQNRHNTVTEFLEHVLLLPHDKAADEACKIEHVITQETTIRLKNCTEYFENELFNKNKKVRNQWEQILNQ